MERNDTVNKLLSELHELDTRILLHTDLKFLCKNMDTMTKWCISFGDEGFLTDCAIRIKRKEVVLACGQAISKLQQREQEYYSIMRKIRAHLPEAEPHLQTYYFDAPDVSRVSAAIRADSDLAASNTAWYDNMLQVQQTLLDLQEQLADIVSSSYRDILSACQESESSTKEYVEDYVV